MLLKTPQSATSVIHTADEFANFFASKINNIRQVTASAPPPAIAARLCDRLPSFDDVTADEVSLIVSRAPTKHCCLDPAPTWLVKRLLPVLTETFAKICNASFHEATALWRYTSLLIIIIIIIIIISSKSQGSRSKTSAEKPTLNPDDMNSFRPISSLSFLSKIVERAATARLSAHIESQRLLLPFRQSAYRTHHLTETAIIAVHDEIVKAIDAGVVCALVLLDLSAAFDTVGHQTLLHVLSCRFGD